MAKANDFKQSLKNNQQSESNNVPTNQQSANPKPKGPRKQVSDLLDRMAPEIEKALPSHLGADRMARVAMTAASSNPKLLQCDPKSFIAAVMQTAQLGLEPNTALGEAYLIPYAGKVQLIISYLGLINLATRSGQYKAIYAHEVYEEDEFYYQYGLRKDIVHKPVDNPRGKPKGYYAVYHLLNGGYDFVYWTTERVQRHAQKYSFAVQKGFDSPWTDEFDQMAKKTVLKDLLKYAPKSIEMNNAVRSDNKESELSDDGVIIDVTDYSDRNSTEQIEQKDNSKTN
ncbi:recombinase RecT [Staphylococcus simulans]|uniref:recombinase RecT n=1 Tax=Staphylococcus simulans TaxID=1286 RepID=UPI000E68854D|nr:recombinase RecT [Staphylococcus simulans]RIN44390.1 recombinase RecT [Staphylococcus simulans]RIN70997.1 recombinase RecT [Staphylococcus simulans]